MFIEQGQGFHWTFNPESRGKPKARAMVVACGYYIIEHVATGKLITGVSKGVSDSVDLELAELRSAKHRIKRFVRLVDSDCELKVYEFPTLSIRDARRNLMALQESVSPPFLLMA